MHTRRLLLGAIVSATALLLARPAPAGDADGPARSQLEAVRARIAGLEGTLVRLDAEEASTRAERDRLGTVLELATARVEELELVLRSSRDEIVRLEAETSAMAEKLARRRAFLERHLEMVALLGRPGPLRLLLDAAQGGDIDQAVGTAAVLTAGQARLMEEYAELQRERNRRLAELSRTLDSAASEAGELVRRRAELKAVEARVERRLHELETRRRRADSSLEELKAREQALGRLLALLAERNRFTGRDDIRRYRGALPWPARGRIVRTFGRHLLPKYETYTVCNGLRLEVEGGAPVAAPFSGVVAYARFFKGYGNMVVIDHGHGVYSLAAGLATILVRLDQRVGMGTRLGLTSPPTPNGNLYVEIRVGEKPEDPRRWLQLEEGRD